MRRGAIKQLDYGNGLRLEMGYNAQRQQPTSMKVAPVSNPNAPVLSYGYNYYDANSHNNNRIRKITDNVAGDYTVDYQYDNYNRLVSAVAPSYSRIYGYDPWGNLTVMGANGATAYTINIAMTGGYGGGAPLTNRILNVVENGQTLAHTYDASGNLTNDGQKTYAYDGAGRMTSVNAGALGTYGYNGDGKRVKKVEAGATTYYVYSAVLGAALFELNGTGVVNRVHVTAGGNEVAQLATDGQFYWLHTDHLGTPRRMTNSTGVVMFRGEYDPHGNPLLEWSAIGNPNLNNNKFTGYERDNAAGLDFAQARHYKYGRGRFMQPDPKGLKAANMKFPESLNRYAYVENDSVNFVDQKGTDKCPPRTTNSAIQICTSAPMPGSGLATNPLMGFGMGGAAGLGGNIPGMLLDTGHEGDGGGGGSWQAPTIAHLSSNLMGRLGSGFNLLINRLRFPTQKCLDNVIGKLSGLTGFDTGKFLNFLGKGFNAYDGAGTTALAEGTLATGIDSKHPYSGKTVQELFSLASRGAITVAVPGTDTLTVFFNPASYAFTSENGIAADWFHEALHGFGVANGLSDDYGDSELKELFGIDEGEDSVEISKKIASNCF